MKTFLRGFCASNEKLWMVMRDVVRIAKCWMTNLVALANKLLWNLEELLNFLGHYAKRKRIMKDRAG